MLVEAGQGPEGTAGAGRVLRFAEQITWNNPQDGRINNSDRGKPDLDGTLCLEPFSIRGSAQCATHWRLRRASLRDVEDARRVGKVSEAPAKLRKHGRDARPAASNHQGIDHPESACEILVLLFRYPFPDQRLAREMLANWCTGK